MKKQKAFTLIELLVVVAIIALLISILLPSLSRARELSKRTVCAANESGLSKALYIYAQDDPGVFPCWTVTTGLPPSNATEGQMALFVQADRTTEPSTTGVPSVTVDMWTIVRNNNTTPKQYICPSTTDVPDPAQDTTVYYDFDGTANLSYAYQYQHDANRRIIGTSSEPTFPMLADANPYIKGNVAAAQVTNDRAGSARGNSLNHTNREGGMVLYQDGHASFEKAPDVGLSGKSQVAAAAGPKFRDNIYTTFGEGTGTVYVDPGTAPIGTGFNTDAGCTNGTSDLGGKSDACLVP